MKTERLFESTDRYLFDFKLCTTGNGYAQIDTSQDAPYFGTWANPFKLRIVNYCEGDITVETADNANEFFEAVKKIKTWSTANGFKFYGIDPGLNEAIESAFVKMGLADYLH